ncbi:hypothetical protein BC941DRAFT_358999 [Chlamydoabsidia padenii]|nr:hypothetical protein BC941DRAFT_358999 [Chlamydoabsidia padenii]
MDQEEAPPFESISTRRLWKELHWIQTYARTLVHQLDPLRPNEQFAQAKEITNRLLSLIRLCSQQHGDDNSLICVMALILVAHECLGGTTAVVRQDMFYRTKVGRTIVLEMSSLFKNYKVGNDKATSRQQHALAILLFDGGDWYSALEIVCGKLSRLDENWEYRNEYHQVITLASSHHLD